MTKHTLPTERMLNTETAGEQVGSRKGGMAKRGGQSGLTVNAEQNSTGRTKLNNNYEKREKTT